ncbi:MAG: (2Fe-2S)-binding protein [Calditrichaeota bacterium]|nr:MAG: (2Fe-2S)-binding protein [Calditrichota bacterium]
MSSCCTPPPRKNTDDERDTQENCCSATEHTEAPAKAACSVSGTISRKVQHTTLQHLLKSEKLVSLQNVQYYYCKEPSCNVVYFSNEKAPYFTTDDMTVKVFAKDQGDDVPVCYCFNWTRARIKQEILETGASTAAAEITKEIKAENCNCEINNPKGECCLGDVNASVKKMKELYNEVQ